MNINELIQKMKVNGVKSLTDSEIESVDFTKVTIENDKELAEMVKIIHGSKLVKSMDSLVNESCRKFIKECRDISAKKSTPEATVIGGEPAQSDDLVTPETTTDEGDGEGAGDVTEGDGVTTNDANAQA